MLKILKICGTVVLNTDYSGVGFIYTQYQTAV